jgi:hypothetical protein
VALAAEGDVFAILNVLVVWILILFSGMEKILAATCAILVFTPWPISTAPVVMPTLPSVYTCTSERAWFINVFVNDMPKQMGIQAMPFLE